MILIMTSNKSNYNDPNFNCENLAESVLSTQWKCFTDSNKTGNLCLTTDRSAKSKF